MRPAIRRGITASGLRWVAVSMAAVALGCAHSSEPGSGDGDDVVLGRDGAIVGEEIGEGEFGRYGEIAGSELSASERSALGLQPVYFDFDQFSLSSAARSALRENAEILKRHGDILVEIQGNCDERGSEEYNLALGERRARTARDYLVNSGVSRDRITTVSFGENNPVATGQSERAWQLNRRDDFIPKR